ncbi:hypothetical protein MNBD_ACTINO01-1236 [hydrothermal vent metagenome]|uniref:N-acetyltransferase domain-containing protein n=1 Tax=hydrothermal vent metagenome TaxID=652676 RepID=A0A3B0SWR0_9ZZZZ
MVALSEITDAAVFLERVGGLVADEARNNLIVSIAGTIVRDPDVFPDRSMYVVEQSGEPVAASLMTVPYNMILTDALDAEAAALLAEHVFDRGVAIPGVTGNRPTVDAFVEAWEARSGTVAELSMRQGVFSLEAVEDIAGGPGEARQGVPEDRGFIVEWQLEFAAEALPDEEHDPDAMIEMVERRLSDNGPGGYWLWIDEGEVVSLSGHGGPTASGIRIGPVYTPLHLRGHGYATSVVAHQSQALLGAGYRFCFLYTDLANSTSNEIYRRIGYHQVAESAMYRFD